MAGPAGPKYYNLTTPTKIELLATFSFGSLQTPTPFLELERSYDFNA